MWRGLLVRIITDATLFECVYWCVYCVGSNQFVVSIFLKDNVKKYKFDSDLVFFVSVGICSILFSALKLFQIIDTQKIDISKKSMEDEMPKAELLKK